MTAGRPTTRSSAYGQAVTFTATVTAVAPATRRPTGVVQFWEGPSCSARPASSRAPPNQGLEGRVRQLDADAGSHAIRAVYVGNFNFNGRNATTAQTVQGSTATVTGIESSANPIDLR